MSEWPYPPNPGQPPFYGSSPYYGPGGDCGCSPSIPPCPPRLPQQASIPGQLEQLNLNLFGPIQVQVVNGRPVFSGPCGLASQVGSYVRMPNEGFVCYIIRILSILVNGTSPGGFACQIFAAADLLNTPTANGQKVAGYSVVPGINVINSGQLSWFLLIAGNSGSFIPNDANASTNNVSWKQVL
jgi:hypothetical protein